MDTTEICTQFGQPLRGWRELTSGTLSVPRKFHGVYIIRTANGEAIGRFVGKSDVIYIGCGNVRSRLIQHARSRGDLQDKGWQLTFMARNRTLEFGFFPSDHPKQDETQLLGQYLIDHLELPPANRRLQLSKGQKMHLVLSRLSDRPLSALKQISLVSGLSPTTEK